MATITTDTPNPEQAKRITDALIADITTGIPDDPVRQVVVGFHWTAVMTATALGLASTPSRADDARTTADTGSFAGRPLSALAALSGSDNRYERAIGIAAANAHWNVGHADLPDANGLSSPDPSNTVVVGRFPGLDERLPGALVLELNPGPDDMPASAAYAMVPRAEYLLITASSLVNNTVGDLLALSAEGAQVSMVGPGTPLCPGLLKHGLANLSGFTTEQPDAVFKLIMEGAGTRQFRHLGRTVTMTA